MNPPKERKYTQCFKSDRDGSCNYCKTRSWRKGNKIYGMKKPDGKWLVCSDRKCYLEQGGVLEVNNNTPLSFAANGGDSMTIPMDWPTTGLMNTYNYFPITEKQDAKQELRTQVLVLQKQVNRLVEYVMENEK